MDLKDLLPIIFERNNATQTLWNLQIVVIAGLLGFVTTARNTARQPIVKWILTITYPVFSYVNLDALLSVTKERKILAAAALSKLPSEEPLASFNSTKSLLSPPSPISVIVLHLVMDVSLVAAIWLFPLLNRRN
jgi:hypothetical protein